MAHVDARSPPTASPGGPVRAALDDPGLRAELVRHANARLGLWLKDQPPAVRAEAAEDSVQEAAKRALERKDRFDSAQVSPAGWIHGILEFVLTEQCRKLRKQPAQPSANPGEWDSLAARLERDDSWVRELLAKLSDESRRIVTLHHIDGLSHDEIAAALGISVGNSRVRLARAMAALKELCGQGGDR